MRRMTTERALGSAAGAPPHRLVEAIQRLSLARDLPAVMAIVRTTARELTGADGATFVLRDGPYCHYADEDAIAPLWKGKRFPMDVCISGWVMLHRTAAAIPDIYADPRIPADAYRETFVKSLVMVPIRTADPIGAIGAYWARERAPSEAEMRLLQALADSTSIAMENVALVAGLERRVAERTAQLENVNRELEAFCYSVSHDLKAPLRAIDGFTRICVEEHGEKLGEEGRRLLGFVQRGAGRMNALIEDLLALSRVTRHEIRRARVDLTAIAHDVAAELRAREPDRRVDLVVADGLAADADPGLARVVLVNLLGNAWKYTSKLEHAHVEVGMEPAGGGEPATFFVRDDGAGFDMAYADRLFTAFQRLHPADQFPGSGIGLATVQRIVTRHGGRVAAEGIPGRGATFRFSFGS
jgi:signal transduction histidine kinase